MNSETLKELVINTFSEVSYPKGKLTNMAYDDEGVSEFFTGKSWQSLQASELRKHCVALNLLEPEAFRYFLPAFMLAELSAPEIADVVGSNIVYGFGKPESHSEETYKNRMSLFSRNEISAILEFIDYMQEKYGGFEKEVIYASSQLYT